MKIKVYRSSDPEFETSNISLEDLPRCKEENCKALLRPHIVWFGENLEKKIMAKAGKKITFFVFRLNTYNEKYINIQIN